MRRGKSLSLLLLVRWAPAPAGRRRRRRPTRRPSASIRRRPTRARSTSIAPAGSALARSVDVAIVGGATAELAPNSYIRLEGPPGPVEVDCKVGDRTAAGQVQIADGQIRFVEVSMTMGWWTPGCEVAEVPPDKGQAAVLIAKRIEPQ